MANEDIDLKQPENNGNKGGNNSDLIKTIIINVVSTTLLCVIFLCANFVIQTHLLNSKLAGMNQTEDSTDANAEDSEEIQHGVVVDLGDFILNLADENQRRYLKTNIALELSQPAGADAAAAGEGGGEEAKGGEKKEGGEAAASGEGAAPPGLEKLLAEYKPAIRDAVITNLSSKTAAELSTVAGKELAKEQIMAAINGILQGQNEVLRVSFGQFIIQ